MEREQQEQEQHSAIKNMKEYIKKCNGIQKDN